MSSTKGIMNPTTFSDALAALIWDYLKNDPEHPDRRQTAWGTKTQAGLAACVLRLVQETKPPNTADKVAERGYMVPEVSTETFPGWKQVLISAVPVGSSFMDHPEDQCVITVCEGEGLGRDNFGAWRDISRERLVWIKTADTPSYSEAAARGVRQQAAMQAVLRNAIDAPTTELNIVIRAGSVNAAIQRGKRYYAKSKADGEWKRIDKYRLTRHNNGHRTPEGRSLATGKWFIIDGSNVEERP